MLKTLGQQGEEWAARHYEKLGYKIISRNEFNRRGKQLGEIDFVAIKDKVLVFVEVKTRKSGVNKFGTGAEAVNYFKQQKLRKAVYSFLLRHGEYKDFRPQIDVCVINVDSLDKALYNVIIIANAVNG
jgi:putative endonuclease